MYLSYWQLKTRPFENCCDPAFYYPGESQQAALLKLRYAIENRRGGAILAGPPGSGKTLLVGLLRTMLPERLSPVVHLVFPQMTTEELLAWLSDEVCGTAAGAPAGPVHQSIRHIERFLAENAARGRHAVVVIDEAHLIDDARTLEALRLLLNFESNGQPGLTLLLAGQVKLLPMLDRMPQLEERLGVKCLLRPFGEIETAAYVEHRLRLAGASRPLFDPEALTTLHRLTHGIARRINRLCDLALLIGFAEERQSITAAQLEAVSDELVAVVPE